MSGLVLLAVWGISVAAQAQTALQAAAFQALLDRQQQAWLKADFSIGANDWATDGELTSPGGTLRKLRFSPP